MTFKSTIVQAYEEQFMFCITQRGMLQQLVWVGEIENILYCLILIYGGGCYIRERERGILISHQVACHKIFSAT